MPRPLTYTDEIRKRMLSALKAGASMRDAAGFAGVEWQCFCKWLKAGRRFVDLGPEGEGADERFEQLARDVDQAAHESDVALIGILRRAAEGTRAQPSKDGEPATKAVPGDWRAAESLLKFRADTRERNARVRKIRAEARLAEMRAAGTLPGEKLEHSGPGGAPMVIYLPTKRDDGDDGGGAAGT